MNFIKNFFAALSNSKYGHSLKKWLAIGIYWLIAYVTIRYANVSNAVEVILALGGIMLTLMGINVTDKKITDKTDHKDHDDEDPNNPVI